MVSLSSKKLYLFICTKSSLIIVFYLGLGSLATILFLWTGYISYVNVKYYDKIIAVNETYV